MPWYDGWNETQVKPRVLLFKNILIPWLSLKLIYKQSPQFTSSIISLVRLPYPHLNFADLKTKRLVQPLGRRIRFGNDYQGFHCVLLDGISPSLVHQAAGDTPSAEIRMGANGLVPGQITSAENTQISHQLLSGKSSEPGSQASCCHGPVARRLSLPESPVATF